MSHMVDSLAWHGEVPWHGLGLRLPRRATVDEMIRFGGLDWSVIPRPLFQAGEDGSGASVPGFKALTRSDRPDVTLSVVSESYGIVQNAEALSLAAAAVGSDAAVAEVGGSLDEGRRVFVVLNIESAGFDVAGERIEPYVVCYAGHDGSTAVGFRFTPVRVVCQNTLSVALGVRGPEMTIRHTRNAADRVKRAAEMIDSARAYFGAFKHVALELVKVRLNLGTAADFAARLFPTYRNAAGETVVPSSQRKLVHLFRYQGMNGDTEIAGTRWGFFNAVTALVDHNARGGGSKMARTIGGSDVRDRALDMLLAA